MNKESRDELPLPKLIVVVGPTGSGKTDLAIALAKQYDTDIVSADSRQVYAGMRIGTASPISLNEADEMHDSFTSNTIEEVNHFLFNISTPDKPITLALWQQSAFLAIENTENDVVIMAGGTMLYVDSVVYNYMIPEVPQDDEFRARLEKQSVDELYQLLLGKDEEATKLIDPNNKRRIIRALEVIEATGEKFSSLRKKQKPKYNVKMIGIFPGWDTLKERVTKRTNQMYQGGLLDELTNLREKYGKDCPLLQTLGYKEAGMFLDNKISKDEAKEKTVQATMRYAHRQMSWWRRDKNINWIEEPDINKALEILEYTKP